MRNDEHFQHEQESRHRVDLPITSCVTHQDEHSRQHHRLPLEGLDVGIETAPPKQGNSGEQGETRTERGELGKKTIAHCETYLNKKDDVTASSANTNETASNSGTRKSLSLAMRVSSRATTMPRAASLATSATAATPRAIGVSVVATPQGANILASKEKKISKRTAEAHSISAKQRPA